MYLWVYRPRQVSPSGNGTGGDKVCTLPTHEHGLFCTGYMQYSCLYPDHESENHFSKIKLHNLKFNFATFKLPTDSLIIWDLSIPFKSFLFSIPGLRIMQVFFSQSKVWNSNKHYTSIREDELDTEILPGQMLLPWSGHWSHAEETLVCKEDTYQALHMHK